jgi:hypothetical protein
MSFLDLRVFNESKASCQFGVQACFCSFKSLISYDLKTYIVSEDLLELIVEYTQGEVSRKKTCNTFSARPAALFQRFLSNPAYSLTWSCSNTVGWSSFLFHSRISAASSYTPCKKCVKPFCSADLTVFVLVASKTIEIRFYYCCYGSSRCYISILLG